MSDDHTNKRQDFYSLFAARFCNFEFQVQDQRDPLYQLHQDKLKEINSEYVPIPTRRFLFKI